MALYRAHLPDGQAVSLPLPLQEGRRAWVQVVRGAASLNTVALAAGDGAAVIGEHELRLEGRPGTEAAELLVFDLR